MKYQDLKYQNLLLIIILILLNAQKTNAQDNSTQENGFVALGSDDLSSEAWIDSADTGYVVPVAKKIPPPVVNPKKDPSVGKVEGLGISCDQLVSFVLTKLSGKNPLKNKGRSFGSIKFPNPLNGVNIGRFRKPSIPNPAGLKGITDGVMSQIPEIINIGIPGDIGMISIGTDWLPLKDIGEFNINGLSDEISNFSGWGKNKNGTLEDIKGFVTDADAVMEDIDVGLGSISKALEMVNSAPGAMMGALQAILDEGLKDMPDICEKHLKDDEWKFFTEDVKNSRAYKQVMKEVEKQRRITLRVMDKVDPFNRSSIGGKIGLSAVKAGTTYKKVLPQFYGGNSIGSFIGDTITKIAIPDATETIINMFGETTSLAMASPFECLCVINPLTLSFRPCITGRLPTTITEMSPKFSTFFPKDIAFGIGGSLTSGINASGFPAVVQAYIKGLSSRTANLNVAMTSALTNKGIPHISMPGLTKFGPKDIVTAIKRALAEQTLNTKKLKPHIREAVDRVFAESDPTGEVKEFLSKKNTAQFASSLSSGKDDKPAKPGYSQSIHPLAMLTSGGGGVSSVVCSQSGGGWTPLDWLCSLSKTAGFEKPTEIIQSLVFSQDPRESVIFKTLGPIFGIAFGNNNGNALKDAIIANFANQWECPDLAMNLGYTIPGLVPISGIGEKFNEAKKLCTRMGRKLFNSAGFSEKIADQKSSFFSAFEDLALFSTSCSKLQNHQGCRSAMVDLDYEESFKDKDETTSVLNPSSMTWLPPFNKISATDAFRPRIADNQIAEVKKPLHLRMSQEELTELIGKENNLNEALVFNDDRTTSARGPLVMSMFQHQVKCQAGVLMWGERDEFTEANRDKFLYSDKTRTNVTLVGE
jgi:hypothetical protein